MGRNSFYILSFGFTFSTLNFKFSSTLVESSLQITPFYAKQTQFQKKSNDVYPYNTTDYERKRDWTLGESKPNSNPIKPNLRNAQMNINSIITKDYRKKDDFTVRKSKPNSNPISAGSLLNLSINFADSTNCNVPTPRLISGTGCSYLGWRKILLNKETEWQTNNLG